MIKTETEQRREIPDALLVAYLDMRGFHIKPKTLSNGRITFEVSGNKLDEELELYYQNPKVPINSFCASYKKIKSMLYNLKG